MAKRIARDQELSTRSSIEDQCLDVFKDIEKGYTDQRERADSCLDAWDAYNCKLGSKQQYSGNNQTFIPIIHDAMEARVTRFVNQLFPKAGRYVDVTTANGEEPDALMSLLEHYVDRTKLRTQIVPALIRNGDCEGQYSLYVDWLTTTRHVAERVSRPIEINGLEFEELGETESVEESERDHIGPSVEIIPDSDLLVLPTTADSVDEAMAVGGSVTILRRWSKRKIRQMMSAGDIRREQGEFLIKSMEGKGPPSRVDTEKHNAEAAGIHGHGMKWCLVYETWTSLKIDGEHRTCRIYYGGERTVLGCKLNPYWCDRVPVISGPVRKQAGNFKGKAPVDFCMDVQITANDTWNMGMDTAQFSAMPIIMTDPEKNPRVGSMVLGLAAVWQTSPKDTQFAQFPPLWRDMLEIVGACRNQIFQTLGVNPSMMPQSTGGKSKRNQAEIALEQQVDLLTTADAVVVLEETVLTPLLQRFAEYDHQFRDEELTVRAFGELGVRAEMETIPPIQMNRRYFFRWLGVESAKNAAQVQQRIAGMNILRSIPPQMTPGFQTDLVPIVRQFVEDTYGPRMAPLIFKDLKQQLGMEPEQENEMLMEGFDLLVHQFDNDQAHMQAHLRALRETGDPQRNIRAHIMLHQQQMAAKAQMQQMQQQQAQGGGGPGQPQPGGQPAGPRQMKQAPGAIPQDQMGRAGAVVPPRRA